MQQCARKRGARIQVGGGSHPNAKCPRTMESDDDDDDLPSGYYDDGERITVAIHPALLECRVCNGPLKPPLFQCTKGHISCSGCCTGGAQNYECLMCREEETATRCRAMEHVLAGLSVPCAFRVLGCHEMVPYAERQAHEATCYYLTRPCPIADCNGYRSGGSLRDHVVADHREVLRVDVGPGRLTAMRMRAGEHARVLCLGGGSDKEFLLVVGRDIPSGRALSVIRLFDEPLDADEKFRYRIEVAGGASVFSLSGQPGGADHLMKPYQAGAFLFVPNAVWDADPEDVPVFVELN